MQKPEVENCKPRMLTVNATDLFHMWGPQKLQYPASHRENLTEENGGEKAGIDLRISEPC